MSRAKLLYQNIEIPLVPILSEMELTGVKVDPTVLHKLSDDLYEQKIDLEGKIFPLAGGRFNINSKRQLGAILFEKLELPYNWDFTKDGDYKTGDEILEQFAGKHEIIEYIQKYKSYDKIDSTFAIGLLRFINARTRRIHANLNQTFAVSGRITCSKPNLQQLPNKSKGEYGLRVREAIVAEKGCLLQSFDLSQIEICITAQLSGDANLQKALRMGEDLHKAVASLMLGIPLDIVTVQMREWAKALNFGIIFGKHYKTLAKDLKISQDEAQELMETYFDMYPDVKQYIDDTTRLVTRKGYAETIMGRRVYLPDLKSPNWGKKKHAERSGVNHTIQGSAADLLKLAMINIDKTLKSKNMGSKMILPIHDELLFEVPEREVVPLKSIVCEKMSTAMPLDVPVNVNIGIGKNWREADPK